MYIYSLTISNNHITVKCMQKSTRLDTPSQSQAEYEYFQ